MLTWKSDISPLFIYLFIVSESLKRSDVLSLITIQWKTWYNGKENIQSNISLQNLDLSGKLPAFQPSIPLQNDPKQQYRYTFPIVQWQKPSFVSCGRSEFGTLPQDTKFCRFPMYWSPHKLVESTASNERSFHYSVTAVKCLDPDQAGP